MVTEFAFPQILRTIVLVAIAAWASLLSHLCISNFNDGARPVFPELMEGRMSRTEFAVVVTGMGVGWVLAGFSQWLATGLIACHLILIATDCLGAWAPNKYVALGLGAAYALVCAYGTAGINAAFNALPHNFLNDLTNITSPVLPVFCMYPAVAIAGQFDAKKGIIAGCVTALTYIVCTLIGSIRIGKISIALYPYTFAMLAGMICLVFYAVKASKNSGEIEVTEEEENLFTKNAERIKSNWLYLCIQGALNALGIKILAQAYQPVQLAAAITAGDMSVFWLAMVGVVIAFIPLIVSTALATGVYQAVGLTTVMLFGTMVPDSVWFLAPVAGFVAEYIEIQLLGLLGKFLSKFPELSKCGDHIRDAMISCLTLALTIGAFMAGNSIWSGVGFTIVGGFYVLNEITGQRIPKTAIGPIGAVAVGIIYNILILVGLIKIG
ncbi:MAG: hypothetical protein II161_04920 [Erysipelotrichaceae bacterium]|nr:hypothetical protein [Erysipelotrichaceae bacterium]